MVPMPIGVVAPQIGRRQNVVSVTVLRLYPAECFVPRCLIHTLLEILFLKPPIDTTLTCLRLESNALVTLTILRSRPKP
jgi:hypothetical protein